MKAKFVVGGIARTGAQLRDDNGLQLFRREWRNISFELDELFHAVGQKQLMEDVATVLDLLLG